MRLQFFVHGSMDMATVKLAAIKDRMIEEIRCVTWMKYRRLICDMAFNYSGIEFTATEGGVGCWPRAVKLRSRVFV